MFLVMMNQNNPSNDSLEPVNVVPGSQWADTRNNPFNKTIIEITNVRGKFAQYKFVILNNEPWDTGNLFSVSLDRFHNSWIHPESEQAKANNMGLSLEDYRTFVQEQEHEEQEWQKYLREKRGHDKFYDREEASI